MNDLLDHAIAEARTHAPTDTVIYRALEFQHISFTEPLRVVRRSPSERSPHMAFGLEDDAPENPAETVDFLRVPFEVTLPRQGSRSPGQLTLRVDNIGRELSERLNAAREDRSPLHIIYREYVEGDEGYPAEVMRGFQVHSVSVASESCEGSAKLVDWLNKVVGKAYTPEEFPGLVRRNG